MDDADLQAAAEALWDADSRAAPIPPLTGRWPAIDPMDAYRIQLLNIGRKVQGGAAVRGHKVGLSSRVMQRMIGVDEPDYGHLLDDMFVPEGSTIDTSALCQPRVEIEVAFVLGGRLPMGGCTAADVLRATEMVLPAIEIIDSRIEGWKIKLPDTIADNASSCRVVLGARPTPLERCDVRLIGAVLRRNGAVVETGAAGAVLGNPVNAVAWLANKVAGYGISLEPGHVVMPGSCTRAVDVGPGDVVRADFDVLGHVTVAFS